MGGKGWERVGRGRKVMDERFLVYVSDNVNAHNDNLWKGHKARN
jgi:hypothetical protein